jgi:GT2 family glycosyltransferase
MDLSIIIVNYNVKYFLEQCLHAVSRAIARIEAEIIVVDNCSADGSVQMISERFPQVKLIVNTSNHGFAKANNQAIQRATGKYILLLNPDTVVQEDTFVSCIDYMNANPNAGCLGVKMIDGKGKYLPESKRALPTPLVAFYKVFGLSALFPRSKHFARYHLGFLNRDQIHKVDVISGAFMLSGDRCSKKREYWMKIFLCMVRILIYPTGLKRKVMTMCIIRTQQSFTTKAKAQKKAASIMC